MPNLNDDPAIAKQQEADDDHMLKVLRDYTTNHVDPYPWVLQVIGTVLNAGLQAPHIGLGAETRLLEKIQRRTHGHLLHDDVHSAAFVAKEE